jgi:hypothetical protein
MGNLIKTDGINRALKTIEYQEVSLHERDVTENPTKWRKVHRRRSVKYRIKKIIKKIAGKTLDKPKKA